MYFSTDPGSVNENKECKHDMFMLNLRVVIKNCQTEFAFVLFSLYEYISELNSNLYLSVLFLLDPLAPRAGF